MYASAPLLAPPQAPPTLLPPTLLPPPLLPPRPVGAASFFLAFAAAAACAACAACAARGANAFAGGGCSAPRAGGAGTAGPHLVEVRVLRRSRHDDGGRECCPDAIAH